MTHPTTETVKKPTALGSLLVGLLAASGLFGIGGLFILGLRIVPERFRLLYLLGVMFIATVGFLANSFHQHCLKENERHE